MSDDHWHRPLTHVRAGELSGDTGQTSGMARWEAISGKSAGAEKLWMGQTHVAAGAKSGNHHHGEAETAIYVVSGTPAFVFADGDEEIRLETKPGDYIFVPPYVPHREEPGRGRGRRRHRAQQPGGHRGQPAEPAARGVLGSPRSGPARAHGVSTQNPCVPSRPSCPTRPYSQSR